MGYYIVPDLTAEAVVCQKPCQYKDCEANRKEWTNAKCCDCGTADIRDDFLLQASQAEDFAPMLSTL